MIERTGSSSHVKLVPYAEAYGPGFEELGHRVPDISALEALTGWTPSRTIDETVDDVIVYEQSEARRTRAEQAPDSAERKRTGALRVAR